MPLGQTRHQETLEATPFPFAIYACDGLCLGANAQIEQLFQAPRSTVLTGVPVVDTQVANTLLQAAQAIKLLGAQVILTGIRPEVAQTLVGLGVDLSGISTRATLQSGIAEALAQRSDAAPSRRW